MMLRCFWVVWSILAWLSAVLCTAGCLFPYWLKGTFLVTVSREAGHNLSNTTPPSTVTKYLTSHLGLFRRCVYPIYMSSSPSLASPATSTIGLQSTCGHYSFNDIPHLAWKLGLVTLGMSCVILFFITFFLFVSGFNLKLLTHACVYKICQFGFLVSGLLVLLTCIMYPVGWVRNREVHQICGPQANSFNFGNCEIGWAYIITICGGCIALLATLLPSLFPLHPISSMVMLEKQESVMNGVTLPAPQPLLLQQQQQQPKLGFPSPPPQHLGLVVALPPPQPNADQLSVNQSSNRRKARSICEQGPNESAMMETSGYSSSLVGPTTGYRLLVPAAGPVLLEPTTTSQPTQV